MTAIPFDELKNRVQSYAADCFDNFTASNGLKFGEHRLLTYEGTENETTALFPGLKIAASGRLNDWAFRQVADRLDAPPIPWLGNEKHCPDEIATDLLNQLALLRDPITLRMRHKGDDVRAVLSDQYTPYDNPALIDAVGDAIASMGIAPQIHRAEIGDDLRAYILFPQITFSDDPAKPPVVDPNPSTVNLPGSLANHTWSGGHPYGNGGLHPALYISNSERGGGSVHVNGAIFRAVCSNGLIVGWNTAEMFSARHRFISGAAMGLLVAEGIALGLRMSEKAAKIFVDTQAQKLEAPKMRSIVDEWATRYGISVEARENWLAVVSAEAMSYGRPQTPAVFDLINAATYVAQERDSNERETMERMAGDLLFIGGNRRQEDQ